MGFLHVSVRSLSSSLHYVCIWRLCKRLRGYECVRRKTMIEEALPRFLFCLMELQGVASVCGGM